MVINKFKYAFKRIKTIANFNFKLGSLGKSTYIDSRLIVLKSPRNIHIGSNVSIRYGARLETFPEYLLKPTIIIGDGTIIETFVHIGAMEGVEIKNNVLIASNVFITDHNHIFLDTTIPILKQGIQNKGKVTIEDNVWLGNNVVILGGVTIGKNSVVGANSVVTKSIPNNVVAGGIPAKIIKQIK